MSAERLRETAAIVREEWREGAGTGDYVADAMLIVADWLDSEAQRCEQLMRAVPMVTAHPGNVPEWKLGHAFRFADAYLVSDECNLQRKPDASWRSAPTLQKGAREHG